MKSIILTCSGVNGLAIDRFRIEIDELTGDAQICNERAARIERDRSSHLDVVDEDTEETICAIVLSVEAAP